MYLIVNGDCFGDGYLRFYYFCMWCTFLYLMKIFVVVGGVVVLSMLA